MFFRVLRISLRKSSHQTPIELAWLKREFRNLCIEALEHVFSECLEYHYASLPIELPLSWLG